MGSWDAALTDKTIGAGHGEGTGGAKMLVGLKKKTV